MLCTFCGILIPMNHDFTHLKCKIDAMARNTKGGVYEIR
jgi:hypothetical protein